MRWLGTPEEPTRLAWLVGILLIVGFVLLASVRGS